MRLSYPHDLEPPLSSQELLPISPLDYPVCCGSTVQVAWVLGRDTRHPVRLEGLALGVTGAQAMFNAVITLALSFIVFTFGSFLVAIQVASGQYTPRIIATTLLRDNVIRYTAGLFVFTLLFAIKAGDWNGGDCSPISRVRRRSPWISLHRSFPVFDRLRGENAAPGQSRRARRGETGSR